jgi:asparagine synthase (glutamine-hydrolysing)
MTDGNGLWIVYNGEIYNYLELRDELAGGGHRFRSNSDTEVILAAYRAWGPECLQRFNGMWAFAIYEPARRRLFLARDRFGVKPFYYRIRPGRLEFASELKQYAVLGDAPRTVNRKLLADLLFWKYETHTDESFFEDVRALPAGHFVLVDRTGIESGRLEPCRFWIPRPGAPLPPAEAASEFHRLFLDAVSLRLRADVPVGVTLSGGLDSSSITCLAALLRAASGAPPLRVFTAVFEGKGFSEEEYAAEVAAAARAEHTLIRPEHGVLASDWDRFIRTMDEPFSSLSYYANWKVYQKIREAGLKVILNGQGGDELLLGYDRYRVFLLHLLLRKLQVGRAIHEAEAAWRHAAIPVWRLLAYYGYFLLPRVRAARGLRRVKPYLKSDFFEFGKSRREHLVREATFPSRKALQEQEFASCTLPHLLHHEDRVSMGHSVEARLPFLDYRLFEFMLGQTDDLLVKNGWSKVILRESMAGILPERVRTRRLKMGFDTPTLRLLLANQDRFEGLLDRHGDDPLVDSQALRTAMRAGRADEHVLCASLTYLSWKEVFGIHAA